jgi:two-component system NarL family sensor kinase
LHFCEPLTVQNLAVVSFFTFLTGITVFDRASNLPGDQNVIKARLDSISYYFETSQPAKGRKLIDLTLRDKVEGSDEIRTYLLLGEIEEFEGYSTNALVSFRKAKKLADIGSEREFVIHSLVGMATARVNMGMYDSALTFLDDAWRMDSTGILGVNNLLTRARYWQTQNQADRALKDFHKAVDKAQTLGLKKQESLAYSGMASVLFSLDPTMQKVIRYLNEANRVVDSTRQPNILARNYTRRANAAMVLGNLPDAALYLGKAKRIIDITGNLPVKSYMMGSYSILKSEQGDIQGALDYSKEPARIKKELELLHQLQNDLLNISEYQIALKKYNDAYQTIKEGIATSAGLKDYVYLQYFYDRYSRVDSLTGNFASAYSNMKKSLAFKDSTISVQQMKAVAEMQEKFESEQREKLLAEKELVIERQKYSMVIIAGAALIVILVGIVIFVVFRNKHRLRLQVEKERHHQLQLQTIVNTQEEVQQSIARDIHDGLVQMMGAAKLSLAAISTTGENNKTRDSITKASQIMDDACNEARQISHQLLPYSLMKDGLPSAIEDLLKKSFRRYEFKKETEERKLNTDKAIHIYRIAQEVVNNIIKHAEADQVWAELRSTASETVVSFRDNGKGYDPNIASNGAGTLNIQTRAELIGAVLDVDSAPARGTFIRLTVSNG